MFVFERRCVLNLRETFRLLFLGIRSAANRLPLAHFVIRPVVLELEKVRCKEKRRARVKINYWAALPAGASD